MENNERENVFAAQPAEAKKNRHVGLTILAAFMCLLIVCGTAMSALSLWLQLGGGPEGLVSEDEDVAREDDVVIAGEYTIRSTSRISDAYLSGDSSGLSDRDKETLDMASKVIDEIITDDMDDVAKETAVYEYLTKNLASDTGMLTVIPTSEENSDEPYGVLKNGSAVCVGYATTFRLLLQMLGMECMVVHDSYLTHSWDLVKLDGEWYHTDCYFDSPSGNFRHFNMNDTIRAEDEEWNTDFFPEASGTKHNPAIRDSVKVKDVCEVPALLKTAADEGKDFAAFRFVSGIEDESAAAYMVDMLSSAVSISSDSAEESLDSFWLEDGDDYVLGLFLTRYEYSEHYDVSDEDMAKITDAVNEAFGTDLDPSDSYVPEDYRCGTDTEKEVYCYDGT